MSEHCKPIWLALGVEKSGAIQIFGAFTVKGLAEQRCKIAQEQRAKDVAWQASPGASFFVEEVAMCSVLTDDTLHAPIRLAANNGGFSSDGR